MVDGDGVGVVVIGRNEGARLHRCLRSVMEVQWRVYVDSGSTDGSQALARELGFEVVELKVPPPFTAARARNAGLRILLEHNPKLTFVQMVDGDCEVAQGWIRAACLELATDRRKAVVFGRRRERHPNATIYNMICDDEWDVPIGKANSCGGDAMFRVSALVEVGGYDDGLIAGEEPDLCLRLRRNKWTIERVAAEMTLHDVALVRFSQWWKRARRGGHAFAELVYRHGHDSDPSWVRQLASLTMWVSLSLSAAILLAGGLLTGSTLIAALGGVLGSAFAAQFLRLAARRYAQGMPLRSAVAWAYLIMLGKFAQIQGAIQFHWKRIMGRASTLIEYKS